MVLIFDFEVLCGFYHEGKGKQNHNCEKEVKQAGSEAQMPLWPLLLSLYTALGFPLFQQKNGPKDKVIYLIKDCLNLLPEHVYTFEKLLLLTYLTLKQFGLSKICLRTTFIWFTYISALNDFR